MAGLIARCVDNLHCALLTGGLLVRVQRAALSLYREQVAQLPLRGRPAELQTLLVASPRNQPSSNSSCFRTAPSSGGSVSSMSPTQRDLRLRKCSEKRRPTPA